MLSIVINTSPITHEADTGGGLAICVPLARQSKQRLGIARRSGSVRP
jgi:hypothetical protein